MGSVISMVQLYSAWGDEAATCCSVLVDDRVDSAISDKNSVARVWQNSTIQSWKKDVTLPTRREAVKDEERNVMIDISPS